MSYTINLTNGNVFATIPDGTINTTSSMTLIGKNYAGYGQFLDDNFIHLLECGANGTAPGAPLTGQLWFNTSTGVLNVYNGTLFKPIGGAAAASSAPSNNTTGDLWYDTTNAQLNVWTGSTWLLVGPTYTSTTGLTGAIPVSITDSSATSHVALELYVGNTIVGIVSKDASYSPQTPISGFSNVSPGITLAGSIGNINPLFQGTATNSQYLGGLSATQFMRADANTATTGTLAINNNTGLTVGAGGDFSIGVANTNVTLSNNDSGGNIVFKANVAGTLTTAMTIYGNGTISGQQINANYADVAERFHADAVYDAGTVVELGGTNEITLASAELSDRVFGVISTKAAYLMNSRAGDDLTHPPVAMTGRVPVKVIGTVNKGDRLVTAGEGMARSAKPGEATSFNVIGRALTSKLDAGTGTVEAIVTIK